MGGVADSFTWEEGLAEGGRILPPKPTARFPLCHEDLSPRLSPTAPPHTPQACFLLQTSSGLGLPRTRAPLAFQLLVGAAFARVARSNISLGPFHTARLSITQLLARVKVWRAAQRVAHRKKLVQPEQTLLVWNTHWEKASSAGLKSSAFSG